MQISTYQTRITGILSTYTTPTNHDFITDLAMAAISYEEASREGRDADAAGHLAEYERLTQRLGFDPLDR